MSKHGIARKLVTLEVSDDGIRIIPGLTNDRKEMYNIPLDVEPALVKQLLLEYAQRIVSEEIVGLQSLYKTVTAEKGTKKK